MCCRGFSRLSSRETGRYCYYVFGAWTCICLQEVFSYLFSVLGPFTYSLVERTNPPVSLTYLLVSNFILFDASAKHLRLCFKPSRPFFKNTCCFTGSQTEWFINLHFHILSPLTNLITFISRDQLTSSEPLAWICWLVLVTSVSLDTSATWQVGGSKHVVQLLEIVWAGALA